ncbi:MAG: enoyl-CoA hydratase-related protein [Microbacterium sp.]
MLLERDGAVAVVTLNRPDRRNALTAEVKEALLAAVEEVGADDGVRAVVLTANGPAFSVGQDLAEHARALADGADLAFSTVRAHYSPIVRGLMTMPKPVVAAVAGACVGAGLGFALACDHRVFGPGARLGTAFSGIALTFDSGLSYSLPRAVGAARARELILFSRILDPAEAIAWGIAGEISEDPAARAAELAGALAQGPTTAFAQSKRMLLDLDALDAALAAEAAGQTACGATEDHRGAVEAFLARRSPTFSGR